MHLSMNLPDAFSHAKDALHNLSDLKTNIHEHHYLDAVQNVGNIITDVNVIVHDLQ